jgi:hypothetical protein
MYVYVYTFINVVHISVYIFKYVHVCVCKYTYIHMEIKCIHIYDILLPFCELFNQRFTTLFDLKSVIYLTRFCKTKIYIVIYTKSRPALCFTFLFIIHSQNSFRGLQELSTQKISMTQVEKMIKKHLNSRGIRNL